MQCWQTAVMRKPRRYLIVGPSWVGDMVMAQSLFITLKQKHPDCRIDVLAPAWSLPVLARMPQVDRGIEDTTAHGEFGLWKRIRQGKELRNAGYTHAIVTPRSWKSALVPFFARVPERTGYKGEQRYGLLNRILALDKTILQQTVQRYVALADGGRVSHAPETPFPVLDIDVDNRAKVMARLELDTDQPIICMMPGAEYGPAKQWPIASYTELARQLLDDGKQVWVLGSDKDAVHGNEISQAGSRVKNLCGKTSLTEVIDLMSCASAAVTNDSGLMHIAAATGVKVVAIYGSSSPGYTPPLTDQSTIIYKQLSCSPCFARTCKYGHYDCLGKVKSADVYRLV